METSIFLRFVEDSIPRAFDYSDSIGPYMDTVRLGELHRLLSYTDLVDLIATIKSYQDPALATTSCDIDKFQEARDQLSSAIADTIPDLDSLPMIILLSGSRATWDPGSKGDIDLKIVVLESDSKMYMNLDFTNATHRGELYDFTLFQDCVDEIASGYGTHAEFFLEEMEDARSAFVYLKNIDEGEVSPVDFIDIHQGIMAAASVVTDVLLVSTPSERGKYKRVVADVLAFANESPSFRAFLYQFLELNILSDRLERRGISFSPKPFGERI